MRYLPFLMKSALRNVRRFVLTVLSVAVSLFMFCTLMTVLSELERENPSEVAHLRRPEGALPAAGCGRHGRQEPGRQV